jgi:SOS-response transcriptional repressor LexA
MTRTVTQEKAFRLLLVIHAFIRERKFPPTVRELMALGNLHSTCTISYHLAILEQQGSIMRIPKFARSITITNKGRRLIRARQARDVVASGAMSGGTQPAFTAQLDNAKK